jgi:hypothetical protein
MSKYFIFIVLLMITFYSQATSISPKEKPKVLLVSAAAKLNEHLTVSKKYDQFYIDKAWSIRRENTDMWVFSVVEIKGGWDFFLVDQNNKIKLLEGDELKYFLEIVGL